VLNMACCKPCKTNEKPATKVAPKDPAKKGK
jgi:hypothetical protein